MKSWLKRRSKRMKLSIHLVTWNGERYIPYLFDSLRRQTQKDWFFFILDNGSTDKTVALMRNELSTLGVAYTLIELTENSGFAAGYNRLFKESRAEFQLILNQDLFLRPDCIERVIQFASLHPEYSALSPRLMKWNFSMIDQGVEKTLTDTVDALGMQIFRRRRVLEQYGGESWELLCERLHTAQDRLSVFGVSGAMALFTYDALRAVEFLDKTVFDESYGSYKEDVDLAFRLQSAGFSSAVVLNATAYHDRSSAGPATVSDVDAAKNKRIQHTYIRYKSYKNHLMTLIKNEYWQNFLLDLPMIIWYELKKMVWYLWYDPSILRGWREVWRYRDTLKRHRAWIRAHRRVSWKDMRRWWSKKGKSL